MADETRALATIDSVLNIKPIPGADKIEVAQVRGWDVVVRKGDFKPGDTCVYFEVDSVLPPFPEYAFLADSWKERVGGYRIKVRRIRGQISYGLALPVEKVHVALEDTDNRLGEDVTELLGVKIYQPPESDNESIKGDFPSHLVPKTSAERVQNVNVLQFTNVLREVYDYDSIEYMASASKLDAMQVLADGKGGPTSSEPQVPGSVYVATEKLDGESFTVFKHNGEVRMCSHGKELCVDTLRASAPKTSFSKVAQKYDWEQIFEDIEDAGVLPGVHNQLAIQMEIVGPKVQKNLYNLDEVDVFVFSVFDIERQVYVAFDTTAQLCAFAGLKQAPLKKVLLTPMFVATLLKDRNIFQKAFQDASGYIEGLVWRPFWEVPRAAMDTLQVKVISGDFLLKKEESE